MPVICAATGCNNTFVKGSEIRFYRFPISKPQLAAQWVQRLGMTKDFIPTPNTCLCSDHFRPDCFRDYNGKQFLRDDAVPQPFVGGQLELRKRGPMAKDNRVAMQDRQAAKDAANQRKDRRQTGFKGRGGGEGTRKRGGKVSASDRQNMGARSKVYDNKGRLLSCSKDMCDCLDVDCMGCFYPCPDCGSLKCGVECRCDRKWLYEQVEVEGGEILRNKYAG